MLQTTIFIYRMPSVTLKEFFQTQKYFKKKWLNYKSLLLRIV